MNPMASLTLEEVQTAFARRFDNIDGALRALLGKFDGLEAHLREQRLAIRALDTRFTALEARFDWFTGRMDRQDQRLAKLDGNPG